MEKILVVDDERDVAELMRLFLNSLGYETDIYLSCEDSLEAIGHNRYGAMFCDYMMPKFTGDLLYLKVKEADSELARRFVLMTGAVLDEVLEEFLKREKVKVIDKPFRLDEIQRILMEIEKQ